jgi:hypothetical protein
LFTTCGKVEKNTESGTPGGIIQFCKIEISPSGLGLYFPAIDADMYLPSLLEGFLGSRHWMAARLGKAGGSVKSGAKAAAVRKNGKLGGRPKKDHVSHHAPMP